MVGAEGTTLVLLLMVQARGFKVPTGLENLYLKPYYRLEQYVASKMIPPATGTLKLRDAEQGDGFDQSLWQQVLTAHVSDGRVNYDGMRKDDRFQQYLKLLAEAEMPKSDVGQLAYHINAYNALCCGLVVANPGIASILDLSNKEKPVWDQVAGRLAGVEVSLNDIEHRRLRATWDEPLIHASIVCASTSCPPLSNIAFPSGTTELESAMQSRARTWLSSLTTGSLADDNSLTLSRIFLWFERDFESVGGPRAFVKAYTDHLPENLNDLPLRYFPYDWSLNSRAV